MSVIGCHPMSRHPMNQSHLNEATRSEMAQSSMSQTSMSSMSTADVTQPASNVERRTFVARSNLFLNFNNRRNIQVGNIPLISPISILSPTSPNGTIFSQIRISPNSLASPLGENGFTLSRRLLGPPDKETETFINTVLELEKEHNKPKQNKENHQRIYEPGPTTVGLNRAVGIHSTANQMTANRMARQESRDIKYDYNLSDISSNHSINNDQQSDMDYQMSEHSNESSDMGMVTSSVGMTSSVTSSDNNHVIQQQHDQYYELIPVEHQDHSRDNLQIIYSTNQNSIRAASNQNTCQPMAESHGNNQQAAMQDPYKPIPTTVILQQTGHKYDSSNMTHHGSQQCRVIQHGLPSDQSVTSQSPITNPTNQSSTGQSTASVEQPIRSVTSLSAGSSRSQSNQKTEPKSGSRAPSSSVVARSAKSGKIKKTPPARNHKCNICNKMFVRPAELQRHIRKHTGERPFKCDDCDMTFMRKDHLTSHQLKHRDQKQFKCRFCDYESNRGDTLKRHCKNKHKNEI